MERLIALLLSIPPQIHPSDFVVCGSGPLAIRGIRDVHDLDLLVCPRVFKEIQRGEIAGFELSSHYDTRTVYVLDTPAGKIDVFATTPRLGRSFDESEDAGYEAHQIEGVGTVHFQSLREVLAIKALAPRAQKHTEDMIMLATRIAAEEAPPPPPPSSLVFGEEVFADPPGMFEVVTGHVEGATNE